MGRRHAQGQGGHHDSQSGAESSRQSRGPQTHKGGAVDAQGPGSRLRHCHDVQHLIHGHPAVDKDLIIYDRYHGHAAEAEKSYFHK